MFKERIHKFLYGFGKKNIEQTKYVQAINIIVAEQNEQKIKSQKLEIQVARKYMCLILPKNKFKQWWDMYIIILLIYTAVVVPYIVCYNINRQDQLSVIFDLTIDFSFFVDIVITFFTAVRINNETLLVRKVDIA